MRKQLLSGLIFSLILFSSAAQAFSAVFLNPGKQGEHFWDMVTATMQAAADDFNIDLEVVYAERNRVKMVQLGLEIIAREKTPEYLILVNEERAAERIFLASRNTNIKTVMLLNDFVENQRGRVGNPGPNNPNLLGAVIPNNFTAGHRMMTALDKCAKDNDAEQPYHMLAIGGDKITPASIDRNNGALSFINEDKNIVLDRFLFAHWSQQEAEQMTERYLKWAQLNNIKPVAIWAANDPIALGAKKAVEQHQLQPGKDVCLVGLNWSSSGIKMVKSGEMVLTDGGHFLAGGWAMVVLNDYHQRLTTSANTPPGRIDFEMQSLDMSNVDLFLKYFSQQQWHNIDFSAFSLNAQQSYTEYDFSLENVFKHTSANR